MTSVLETGVNEQVDDGTESVAKFDDLSWYSNPDCSVSPCPDRRPKWLRRVLPLRYASSSPLQGSDMARIKIAAYH